MNNNVIERKHSRSTPKLLIWITKENLTLSKMLSGFSSSCLTLPSLYRMCFWGRIPMGFKGLFILLVEKSSESKGSNNLKY